MQDEPDELVIGQFDFVQTLRIVTNLVENAFKYSPIDSQIDLSGGGLAEAQGGRVDCEPRAGGGSVFTL